VGARASKARTNLGEDLLLIIYNKYTVISLHIEIKKIAFLKTIVSVNLSDTSSPTSKGTENATCSGLPVVLFTVGFIY
jgi:hypothetical protein